MCMDKLKMLDLISLDPKRRSFRAMLPTQKLQAHHTMADRMLISRKKLNYGIRQTVLTVCCAGFCNYELLLGGHANEDQKVPAVERLQAI